MDKTNEIKTEIENKKAKLAEDKAAIAAAKKIRQDEAKAIKAAKALEAKAVRDAKLEADAKVKAEAKAVRDALAKEKREAKIKAEAVRKAEAAARKAEKAAENQAKLEAKQAKALEAIAARQAKIDNLKDKLELFKDVADKSFNDIKAELIRKNEEFLETVNETRSAKIAAIEKTRNHIAKLQSTLSKKEHELMEWNSKRQDEANKREAKMEAELDRQFKANERNVVIKDRMIAKLEQLEKTQATAQAKLS